MAIIGEFGSAPDFGKVGYKGQGYVVFGTEAQLLNVFRAVDVVLVRGALMAGTDDEYEFYPMYKTKDAASEKTCIGGHIQSIRINHKISISDFAEHIGRTVKEVELMEAGFARPTKQDMTHMVALLGPQLYTQLADSFCS